MVDAHAPFSLSGLTQALSSPAFASSFGLSLTAVHFFWIDFVRRVRGAWEELKPLPHLPDPLAASLAGGAAQPDEAAEMNITLTANLIHQKLELINHCIRLQRVCAPLRPRIDKVSIQT